MPKAWCAAPSPLILLFYLTPVWSTLLARVTLGDPITGPRGRNRPRLAGSRGVGGTSCPVPTRSPTGWVARGPAWAWSMVQLRRVHQATDLDKLVVQFVFLGAACLVSLVRRGAWVNELAALRHAWDGFGARAAGCRLAVADVFGGSR